MSEFNIKGDHTQIALRDLINNAAPRTDQPAEAKAARSSASEAKVFISAISEEYPLANLIQSYLNQIPERSPSFVGNTSITPGAHWLTSIKEALRDCRLVIVLLSPLSLQRHWIHLEAGAALARDIPLLVVAHAGLQYKDIPDPYRQYQHVSFDTDEGIMKFQHEMEAVSATKHPFLRFDLKEIKNKT
jgi:hypothetical protein